MEEVKHVLKPHFIRKYITKDDYKEIMKKSVSKVGLILHLIVLRYDLLTTITLDLFRSATVVRERSIRRRSRPLSMPT